MAQKPDRTKISITDEASLSLLRRVVRDLVRPYTGRLVLAVLCMVLVAAATAASAWLMDPMVNKIFVEKDHSVLWRPISRKCLSDMSVSGWSLTRRPGFTGT